MKFVLICMLFFGSALIANAQCPTVLDDTQSFCDLESPTVASLSAVDAGSGISWYATATSTTPLSLSTVLVNGEDYFVDNSQGNCGSRIRVVVTIYGPPVGSPFGGVCRPTPGEAVIGLLEVFGNNIRWYTTPSGGTALDPNTVLIDGTIYYASQTNPETGCETSRHPQFVNVGIVPTPTGPANQIFCENPLSPPTIANLNASGDNNWYLTPTATSPLNVNTPLVNGQTYYATTTDPPCESTGRLAVTVTLSPRSNPGLDGTLSLCESQLGALNQIRLFDYLNGAPQQIGEWNGPLETGGGHLGLLDPSQLTLIASPYVFTYSVTSGVCSPSSATVTISIIPPPNAGTNGSLTLCSNNPATDLFNALTGTPEAGGTWSPALASGTGFFDPAVDAPGVYTYTVTGTTPCANASATVGVSVVPRPIAGVSTSESFCENATAQNLFTLLGPTAQTGGTWSPALASGTGFFDPSVDAPGTYTYTVSGTSPCESDAATVTISIIPPPNAGTNGSLTLCSNNPATDLFNALTGTPEAGGTWSPALASGTGFFDPAVDAPGVYTYTVTGTTPCANASATVGVSVVPRPIAGVSTSESFCENATAQNLFTLLGPTAQTGGTWSPALASGTGFFDPSVDAPGTYTYTVSGTSPCESDAATVTISIIPPPNAGTNGSLTLCSNNPATDLFNALTGTPEAGGTWSPALASGTGFFDPAVDAPGVYTYTVTGTTPCANASATVGVSVVPRPIAGVSTSESFCENATAQNLFTLLGPTAQTGGTWSPALASGTGFFDPSVDAPGTYTYTVSGTSPCESDAATVTISIIPPPNAGTNGSLTLCSNNPATDLFNALTGTPEAGGTWSPALASGTGFFDPAVDAPGVYTYTVTGTTPCANASATVGVSVVPRPIAGVSTSESFCENATAQNLFTLLGPTAQTGGTWSPALASGTGFFDPSVDAPGTYTYTVSGTSPCESDAASVTITIVPPPNAGNDNQINVCSNSDGVTLFELLGANAQSGGLWTPGLASGTDFFNPAVDAAGVYTYTVSGDVSCGSDSAVITVEVTPGPDAGQNGELVLCSNSLQQNLFNYLEGTPQIGGTWSPALASGTGLFNPAIDQPGVYTYTFSGSQPCDNDIATVTVTVNPEPDAGENGVAFFCTNYAPADLFENLGGTPQPGGVWTPTLASGTGVFNPMIDAAGTYTYVVGGNLCATDTAQVVVTVVQSPNAGGGSTISACATSTAIDLTTGLNGSQGIGDWSDDNSTGALTGNIFNPSIVGPGTYQFSYTVGGGVNPCLFDTAIVTVVVESQPNAGTFSGIQSVCKSTATFDLSTLLNNPQSGGEWTNTAGDVIDQLYTVSNHTAGIHSFIYTVSNSCGSDTETVQLNINPAPSLTIPNITVITPICIGEGVALSFNNLPDATYNLTYNLSGANNQPEQVVTIVVTNGTATLSLSALTIPETGITTITFTNILNTATNCSTALTGILINFVVRPTSDLTDANLSIADSCLGNPATVTISGATGLIDGIYQFNYTISGGTPQTGATGVVTILNGAGSFVINPSVLPTVGSYSLTIANIISLSGGCSSANENASVTFQVVPVTNPILGVLTAVDVCLNSDNTVTISGASSLLDATYMINFNLSGANSAAESTFVQIASGSGTFVIPGSLLSNPGATTLTVSFISIGSNPCGNSGIGFQPITFQVIALETPEPIIGGNEFCAANKPTIADLSSAVVGNYTIIWYDAAVNGNALLSTDLLQHGNNYFASFQSQAGCQSVTRLEITVDLTVCEEQLLIPDGFSPNGDGINDFFEIENLSTRYPKFKLEIYNRYGNILYKGNATTPLWDGTASEGGVKLGEDTLPTGVYFYILEFNDGTRKPLQGRVYLSR